MNTQPEIKSRCQELLKEQEMNRRQIRALISMAAFAMGDLTQCLKPWGWTFSSNKDYINGCWFKTFSLPYPLLTRRNERFYLQQKIIIQLGFSDYYYTYLQIKPYPESDPACYLHSYCNAYGPESNWKMSLILQRTALELSKVISSLKTESFYDETKGERIEVIPVLELTTKIGQVFKETCKAILVMTR